MDYNKNTRLSRSLLDPDDFTLTFELVPGRGGRSREINRVLQLAREVAADKRFQAVSITENAGGHPALSPEVLGKEIHEMDTDVIIHFSCKDKNRNQMESLLFSWNRQELHNLLVIAGDYPKDGYRGFPKPVFDLDTVQALDMLSTMNRGEIIPELAGSKSAGITATSFLKGVAVSPFKLLESEQVMQYGKLKRKVTAGADFAITQLGYDARKFHELLLFMQQHGLDIPVLGNVFIPNRAVAAIMHQGKIPGCVIPDSLYEQIQQEATSTDRGKKAGLERAAKLLAILKGLGYAGAHIGGPGLSFADLDLLLKQAEDMAANWQEYIREFSCWPVKAFYYYEKDRDTGLNQPQETRRPPRKKILHPVYNLSRFVHDLAFDHQGPMYEFIKKICEMLNKSPLRDSLHGLEYLTKSALFNCQDCGDCTLAELAFLCPQSGCAKYLLNGPCGGSRDGWCEVYPGRKRCMYVLLYERLKAMDKGEDKACAFIPPRDWSLNRSSSWINYFLGRDHASKQ